MPKKPPKQAPSISLTDRQRTLLQRWERRRASTPHRLVERSRIILMSADGVSNEEQGRQLNVDRQRVRRWRRRWAEQQERLLAAEREGASDADLTELVRSVLLDDPRSGTPPKFTPEQVAEIIAVACKTPESCGVPVTHWTPHDLAAVVMARGIVEDISHRHIARFLAMRTSSRTKSGTG